MDIGKGSEELVDVKLHFEDGHGRLHLVEEPRSAVDSLWDKLLNQVQVHFILLQWLSVQKRVEMPPRDWGGSWLTRSPLE